MRKNWISAAKAAEALIHKDVDRITSPVQFCKPMKILASYLEISRKVCSLFSSGLRRAGPALRGSFMQYCLRPEIGKVEIAPFAICVDVPLKMQSSFLTRRRMDCRANENVFNPPRGERDGYRNGDITQCDLPRGVCSGLSDGWNVSKKMKWSASSDSVKRIRTFGTLPTYATCIQLSVLSARARANRALFYFINSKDFHFS